MTAYRIQKNFAISSTAKTEMRSAMELLKGSGLTLDAAVRMALDGKRSVERCEVKTAVQRFLESRKDRRGATQRWYDSHLSRLVDNFGDVPMDELDRVEIRKFINDQASTPTTRAAYSRAVRALWRWSVAQEPQIASKDITEGLAVTVRADDNQGAATLDPDTVATIMAKLPIQFQPAAALLFFAGIRPGEIWGYDKEPLKWSAINTTERIIRMPAECTKTRKVRLLEGLPDAVWRWMRPGKADEPICPAQSQHLIRQIQVAGGFIRRAPGRSGARETLKEWPHDATRHSALTYMLALTADASKVSLWAGHEGKPTMLYRHYRGLRTKAEAERYFATSPHTPPALSPESAT